MTETIKQDSVLFKVQLKNRINTAIKELKLPENIKKINKISFVTGYALVVSMTSIVLITSGIHILAESGVPVKTIVQLIGALFIICGLGCARDLFPGIRRIIEK